MKLYRNNQGATRGLDYEHQLEIAIDGERVHLAAFGGQAELDEVLRERDPDLRRRGRAPARARAGQGRAAAW